MKLLIAEKPKVAKESYKELLEQVEGESFILRNGYLEGKNWCISWCIGHLVEMAYPDEYGWQNWNMETLPMIPDEWKFNVKSDKKSQFSILKSLINKSTVVINGTDAGREGELIYRLVMMMLAPNRVEQKRLWVNSFVIKDLIKGWRSMKSSSEYEQLFASALARAQGDWLVGMNLSRAYIIRSGVKQLSVGRVQTPTLGLIVRRDKEVENWKEAFYYELVGQWKGIRFTYYDNEDREFENEAILNRIIDNCKDKQAELIEKDSKDRKESPPKPYDLLRLQIDANKKLGFKLQQALDIAQSLYEKKLISYPRTDSEYLPEAMKDECFDVMDMVMIEEIKPLLRERTEHFSFFNNNKVTDHYAIIPTGELVGTLTDDEKSIYSLIVERFLTAFCKPFKYSQTDMVLRCENYVFKTSIKKILDKGYKTISSELEDRDNDENLVVSDVLVEIGDQTYFDSMNIDKKKRTKPKYYTEGTLGKAMETAGRKIEDEHLRDAMKDRGLGTPVTRSGIIELLKRREYISMKDNKIVSTDLGRKLIEIVSDDLASPELTGEWEFKLRQIERHKFLSGQFISEIKDFVCQEIESIESESFENFSGHQIGNNSRKCPSCNSEMRLNKGGVFCTNCDFKIWRKVASKKLTDNMIDSLLNEGYTSRIKGFKKSDGKKFDAQLVLAEDGRVKFKNSATSR